MKTVALIDFLWVGHHPGFFRLYCQALLAAGCRVIALCPRSEEVEKWFPAACAEGRLVAQEFVDEVMRHRWRRKVPQWANRFRFQQCARRLARWEKETGRQVDTALFACLYQGIAPFGGVDRIFPYRWSGLLLDSGAIRLRTGPGKWRRYRSFDPLALFRAGHCASLATLDPFIRHELGRRTGKQVVVLPEAADDTPPRHDFPLADNIRRAANGRRVIGCFGLFARRKGALDFLRLTEACRDEPWFFVWAGKMEENSFTRAELQWIRAFLGARPSNCQIELGRIADESEFNALVALSDVLHLCYHRHVGSSNMISKAVMFEKPVLVCDGYYMADRTTEYNLGLRVPEGDLPAARDALRRLLNPGSGLPTPRFAEYRAANSPTAFAAAVRAMAGV